MRDSQISQLHIEPSQKQRSSAPFWIILFIVVGIAATVAYFAWPRDSDSVRIVGGKRAASTTASKGEQDGGRSATGVGTNTSSRLTPAETGHVEGSILTVPGYIIPRERIELSPRFMGVVKWIGVKKGDSVTNGQVVVILDDAEYRARLADFDGQLAVANVAVEKARLDLKRTTDLVEKRVEMQKSLDDARLALASAEAQVLQIRGARQLIETYVSWCTIRSPVNGVILERLVDPNELVSPQTFGGTRGPSTSLLAMADLSDLQVEIDVDESYLSKVGLGQKCKLRPEAFPDRLYDGVVAEMAPEASRQKGTLQIKVQVLNPDRYLTLELSAKVDFLPR